MTACVACGSYAINHFLHGRDGSDPDLCDVCFWRKRATPMRRFRIVTHYGRHMVAGGIIPARLLKVGQTWAAADGSNYAVTVEKIEDSWVTYKNSAGYEHEKDTFAFQCRYCLVIDKPELPDELK